MIGADHIPHAAWGGFQMDKHSAYKCHLQTNVWNTWPLSGVIQFVCCHSQKLLISILFSFNFQHPVITENMCIKEKTLQCCNDLIGDTTLGCSTIHTVLR